MVVLIGLAFLALVCVIWALRSRSQTEGFITGLASTPAKFACDIDQGNAQAGLAWFRTQRLVILSVLRDSEGTIELVRRQAEAVGSLFADYAVLIVENDSHDATRAKLLEWAKANRRVHVLGCDHLNLMSCHMNLDRTLVHDRDAARIEKMVKIRNVYLDYLRSDKRISAFDLALVWDMDIEGSLYLDGIGLSGYYLKEGVAGTKVDAICANGATEVADRVEMGKYYDPYAHEDIGQTRTFTTVEDVSPPVCSRAPIPVRSCFNGFTFYRLSALLSRRYELEKVGKEAVCEHVGLHRGMAIYLNPSMVYLMNYRDGMPWDLEL